jgi:predicted dienelactone hydrolase
MKVFHLLMAAILCVSITSYSQSYEFSVKDFNDFKDSARDNREVPMKIYHPSGKGVKGPFPVVVFSHGLGGSKDGYSYLGGYWAGHGIVSVHVQHHGSDGELLKDGKLNAMLQMTKAMSNPENIVNRPKDISFAIDKLAELNASDPDLKGLMDMNALGVAGHSFGAYTTLAVAGQLVGGKQSFHDQRAKAAIEMSAPGRIRAGDIEKSYSPISIPMMHMTGTDDKMPGSASPEDRLLPYQNIKASNQYLIVFDGGEHMLFSGRREKSPEDIANHLLIQKATTAFWLAFLKGEKKSLAYLNSPEGLKADLVARASFERK